MSSPTQLAPMIALYEDEGEYTLRVSDSVLAKSMSVAVLKTIGESTGARRLTLITPTDTKVFKFGAQPSGTSATIAPVAVPIAPRSARPAQVADPSAPPSPEMVEYEAEMAQAAATQAAMDAENAKTVVFEPTPELKKPIKRERAARPTGTPTSCGRCAGSGALPGGGTCPVCKGKGSVAKWGARTR